MTEQQNPSGTTLTIRNFQLADAPTVARLVTDSVRGHWIYSPEQFRESHDPQRRRLVAQQGGEVVATAHLTPFGDGAPDALRLNLAGQSKAFSPLYLAMLAELPAGFGRVLGVTREDFGEQMAFFGAAGFRNAWQSWGAHLDLLAFDFERWRPLEEKRFIAGYEVSRFEPNGPDWDAFVALHETGEADVPRNPVTTPDKLSSDTLREMVQREEAAFVVRYRGELVALTRLTLGEKKGRPGEVESEFTTTAQAHRSGGLATLLKAYALAWARDEGYTHAGTGGAVLNLPMLRVNTRLGYQLEQMWVTWEKPLTTS